MSDVPPLTPTLRGRVHELGALRIALLAAVAVLVASAPFASFVGDGSVEIDFSAALMAESGGLGSSGTDLSLGLLWVTLIAPPLAVMIAFVVPLDMLMSRIYMTDKPEAERARYHRILAAEALALALLAAAWTPFFASLLSL